jgi:hypothetical protein
MFRTVSHKQHALVCVVSTHSPKAQYLKAKSHIEMAWLLVATALEHPLERVVLRAVRAVPPLSVCTAAGPRLSWHEGLCPWGCSTETVEWPS